MTNRQTTTRAGWWWRLLLAAIAAAIVALLGAGTASATTAAVAETRVGASTVAGQTDVGVAERIAAGQRLGNAPPQAETMVATGVAAKAERVAINGETAATKLGRQMHQEWDYGPGYVKEFTLRAGGRPDAINFETRHIFELKPNNPRAIRLGERQIEGYVAKLNEQFPGSPWTGEVVTYGP